MDKKRLIAIIAFSVTVLLLGFAMYWVFFREAPVATPPTTPGVVTEPGAFPSAGPGDRPSVTPVGPGVLPPSGIVERPSAQAPEEIVSRPVEENISNVSLSGNNVNFYNEQDGRFYRVDSAGEVKELSDQVFFNVDTVTWAPNKNESIIEYPDGANIYYNFDTREQVTLPKHWEGFAFSSGGEQIAAKSVGLSPENRWLVVSDPQGTNVELIEPMGENADKVTVAWSPNNQVVATSLTGQALGANRQEVLLVGLHGENFKSLIVEGRGFQSEWSPEGDKLLYSVYSSRSDYKPELWITNASGDAVDTGRQFLSINTWAEKCTFSDSRYIYCGVPSTLDTGAGFAPSLADQTTDVVMRVDLQTGAKTVIPTDSNYVVESMFVSDDGKTLYFSDKNKDGLFTIAL